MIGNGGGKMRTALNLLNKIVDLGYDQQKALNIDKILDKKLGIASCLVFRTG